MNIDLSTIPDAPKNQIDLSAIPDAESEEASWGAVQKSVVNKISPEFLASATGAVALGIGFTENIPSGLFPAVELLKRLKEPVTNLAKHFYEQSEKESEKTNLKPSSAKSLVSGAEQSTAQQLALMGAGAVAKRSPWVLPAMAILAAGRKKSEFLSKGIEGGNLNAAVQGLIEYVTEKGPLAKLGAKGVSLIRRILTSTALDVPGELVATATQSPLDKVALNPEMSWSDFWATMPGQLKDTAIQTVLQSAFMAGPVHGTMKYAEHRQKVKDQLQTNFQVPEPEAETAINTAEQNIQPTPEEAAGLREVLGENPEEEINRAKNAAILSEEMGIDPGIAYEYQDEIIKELENKIATESPMMVGEPESKPAEAPKQPWEMTAKEYNDYRADELMRLFPEQKEFAEEQKLREKDFYWEQSHQEEINKHELQTQVKPEGGITGEKGLKEIGMESPKPAEIAQIYKEEGIKENNSELTPELEKKFDRIITKVGQHWFSEMVRQELAKETLLAKSMTLYSRRKQVRNIRDYFSIPDNIMKKVAGNRDIGLMSDGSFKEFKDKIQFKAVELEDNAHAKAVLVDLIHQKRLQKVYNYRRVLELPSIDKMTTEQLQQFAEALEPFADGDSFLTERELEVVDRTDLKGIRTWREAKEKLAQESGTTIEKLEAIKVGELDEYRYDTALAEKNPFYKLLVTETTRKLLEANSRYYEVEQKAHEFATRSNESRDRGIMGRLIPQDKQIMDYLEATEEAKAGILKEMTPEQVDYAHFIQEYFGQALDYLIKTKALTKGRENYFVHMRRTFLEDVKEAGLKKAFSNVFNHYQQDEATFNILDEDTANILPLEKFFQFALHRSGVLEPTANITKAFLAYARMFEKKVSLDELIPKMDIYAQSLTPERLTPRGLEFDRSIKKFVNKYINNKKGRQIRWLAKQNGPVDMAIGGARTFTTILDLGLNIPVQLASSIGEQVTSLEVLGAKKYALGTKRMLTKEGQAIAKKYKNFTGKTVWDSFIEPDRPITENLMDGVFSLFRESTVRANQQFLLGSLTEEEFKNREVSSKRLADFSLEMGRWRQVEGSSSIVGSTSAGSAAMQYKKWAVPIMRTTIKDISTFSGDLKKKGFSEALKTNEAQELKRLVLITSTAAIIGGMIAGDKDDEGFIGRLKAKAYREMMTLMQGVGFKLWLSTPRVITFLAQLGNNLQQIILLEEYKTKPGYKGVAGLKKQLTPVAVKQVTGEGNKKKEIIE